MALPYAILAGSGGRGALHDRHRTRRARSGRQTIVMTRAAPGSRCYELAVARADSGGIWYRYSRR